MKTTRITTQYINNNDKKHMITTVATQFTHTISMYTIKKKRKTRTRHIHTWR